MWIRLGLRYDRAVEKSKTGIERNEKVAWHEMKWISIPMLGF